MLTDSEKIDARRFMGYPAFGTAPSGNMGWQYYQVAGLLEYRLGNLSSGEETVIRQYLAALNTFEQAIPDAVCGLDTQAAGEWVRNPREMAEKAGLLADWGRRLCTFLGVPPGPQYGGSGGNSVALVV